MKTKTILFLLGTFYILLPVQSQVTIGSLSEPRKGSLLELKENESADENSTKGFSLPRVELKSRKKLAVDDDSKKDQYKGLTIQNTNRSDSDSLAEGVHSWDGENWRYLVAAKGQGTDGQILTSNGTDSVAEWKNQLELHIPTVDFVATGDLIPTINVKDSKVNLLYTILHNNNFSYNNGAITPGKPGYYQINLYNKMDATKATTNETNNEGTAIITLCLREGANYTELLSFSAYYPNGTDTLIHQPLSGLIYLTAGKDYVIRTTYNKKFKVDGGGISFTYLGGS
ncbi:hypothetical protein [Prevotella sp. 10(H)]|uniref:hypothetical protein n=1 Tax=Prevotella sp. 10(H) TaxID=1158294 RepID=UPI0004A76EA7|nr:hypothetical protein [Prevotella sp. 10(H)]